MDGGVPPTTTTTASGGNQAANDGAMINSNNTTVVLGGAKGPDASEGDVWWSATDIVSGPRYPFTNPPPTAKNNAPTTAKKAGDICSREKSDEACYTPGAEADIRAARVRRLGSQPELDGVQVGKDAAEWVQFGSLTFEESERLRELHHQSPLHVSLQAATTTKAKQVEMQCMLAQLFAERDQERKEVEELKNFTRSLYVQIQNHSDFVHGGGFTQHVESIAQTAATTKMLPEIWAVQKGLSDVKDTVQKETHRLDNKSDKITRRIRNLKNELGPSVKHFEVVGTGSSDKHGIRQRKLESEDRLKDSMLGCPPEWEGHSVTETVNYNFEQVGVMLNSVMKNQFQLLEESLSKKIDKLDTKVTVLHNLYNEMRRENGS